MTPEISALIAALNGDNVQKMQETLTLCMEQLETHAFYLANKGLTNDFQMFEKNHRKYTHDKPPSFSEILHRVMPVGDHYSIREINKTVNLDRPGAEITIKILAHPAMSRNQYRMLGGELLFPGVRHEGKEFVSVPVKERMKLNFQASERIDLDDIMPPKPSRDELDRRIANICSEIPQFPQVPKFPGFFNEQIEMPIFGSVMDVLNKHKDDFEEIIQKVIDHNYHPDVSFPISSAVDSPWPKTEDLDTVMRQATIGESDFLVPDKYLEVPKAEPQCLCDTKMLASTGHSDECRWIKWKRSK